MKKVDVVAAVIAIGGVSVLAAFVWKLHKMALNLVAVPKASLHKVDLSGITIRLDVVLKNPTKGTFSIKFPFVKLIYKDSVIGSSQVINKDVGIPAYGQVVIEKIMIDISLLDVVSVSAELVKAIKNKEQVQIKAKIITTVFIGATSMPFDETYNLTVKP